MKLYYNPVSTYSQKALMGFYEKQVEFEPQVVNLGDAASKEKYRKIYPMGKVPLLMRDDGWLIPESTIILEFLDGNFSKGTKLIPDDKEKARQTRFFDRMCDLYIDDSIVTLFFEGLKPEGQRNQEAMEKARFRATTMYEFLDKHLEGKTWLMGDSFTMADCAAAPGLGYATQVFPFAQYKNLTSYWNRLSERPSYQKVMKEAAPVLAQFKGKK